MHAQDRVRELNPNSTIIRSDIQDKTETFAYIHSSKDFWNNRMFNMSVSPLFRPRIVNTTNYANIVAENMKNRVQGKVLCVAGK